MTIGKQLVAAFNDALNEYVSQLTQRAVYLELELEKLYTTLFLAKVRNGTAGARKRYAGIRLGADGPEFVGMEVVRRDWTEIAKRVQQKLYALLFAGDMAQGADPSGEIEDYVRSLVAAVRNGEHDDELVYTKQLRKPVEQYTANVPPHVRAVRLHESEFAGQSGGSGLKRRVVNYVQTLRGPVLLEDLALCGSPLDREHYVERQIEPVVQPVFEILQRDFDQVIGDDRQVELF